MKRNITLGIIGWLMATIGGYKAAAQDSPFKEENKKETQEVIIRKKTDRDTKLTVEITDGKVLINGKPIAEFNEDGVTVNNRKMIVRDGDKYMMEVDGKMMDLNMKLKELDKLNYNFNFDNNNMSWGEGKDYTYMGVTTNKTEEGAEITNITKKSPAEKAGLMEKDVIYKIDDTKIESSGDLSEYIRTKKDGDKVTVYFLRNGKKKDEKVSLGTHKSSMSTFSYTMPDGGMKSITIPRVPAAPGSPRVYNEGMFEGSGNNFTFNRRPKLGLRIQDTEEGTGVKVLDVENESAAATAGMMKDDVITEIGGVKVSTTDDARKQLQDNKEKSSYAVKAKRGGSEMTFNIKIPKNLKTTTL